MLSGTIPQILNLYDQYNNIARPSTVLKPNEYGDVLELEAKFGYYTDRGFNSNVPYVHFERLLNFLRNRLRNETVQESHVRQDGNIRRVTITSIGDTPETVIWQRKELKRNIELAEYDVRISVNIETTLRPTEIPQEFKPTVFRDRTRHTFLMANGNIQVDMTEVMMMGNDKVIRPRYEVELEFLGSQKDLNIFDQYINVIFKLLRGTNRVFTKTDKNHLIDDTIKILGGDKSDMIDKNVLVEARNIKKHDIVWGGIVGNNTTNYLITFKADGLRKILIIHTTGVWLVYPPFEFNLVLDLSIGADWLPDFLNKFNGTIYDGELVIPKVTKQLSYWFLAFDCLAIRGDPSIQNKPYNTRKSFVDLISQKLRNDVITIDTKETKEITSPYEFFTFVTEFLNKRDDLEYNEDGLIFVPNNMIYNPHNQEKYNLHERSLKNIPDICKWKEGKNITIDFSLKWIENGQLELYSYDESKKVLVPFRGNIFNPLTLDMIDYKNELTLGKPTGLIVEYEWNKLPGGDNGILQPRRIRYDKSGPNRLTTALDDWEDVMNPITAEDIKGQTLTLTRSYHNRIKKQLYNLIQVGSNILDIGSGKGGDAAKWARLINKTRGTGLVVAIEPDPDNRAELINRINTFDINNHINVVAAGAEDTITVTQAVKNFIPNQKVDVITLMLSMSFFWASDSHLDALINTIVNNLKPGGLIIFLTIDGDTVEQIFEPALGGPKITDKTIVTADIHLYPKFDPPYGRPLDFILPNTIVGEQREYVVHLQDFSLRLARYGIYIRELHKAEGEKLLTSDNYLFSSMYSYGYFVNDDTDLLRQHQENIKVPINLQLSTLPSPIKFTDIQMNQYLPTNIIQEFPSPSPNLSPQLTSPILLPQLSPNTNEPALEQLSPNINQPVLGQLPLSSQLSPLQVPQNKTQEAPANIQQIPIIPNQNVQQLPVIPRLPLINNGQTTSIPQVVRTEEAQLPWLPVSYSSGIGIVNGAAYNDDTYAPLNCSWHKNLVRIATIGEGSCFIHAVLKGFYRNYQENNNAKYRLDTAAKVRRDLAVNLALENPLYPGYTNWITAGRGAFPRMVLQQISDETLVGEFKLDYSLAGLQRLFNSTHQLGDEVYSFVADSLNIDIYVLRATSEDLYPQQHTHRPDIIRDGIVIIGNNIHYEVLAINTDNGFQTVFHPDDPFLTALTNLFLGNKAFLDIVNIIPYDPDATFIYDVVDAFTTKKDGFVIPDVLNQIFPDRENPNEVDIFKQNFNRLLPNIREAAQVRYQELNLPSPPPLNPVITLLEAILTILGDAGYSEEQIVRIREIVQHKLDLNPDIPQDLNAILATAESDGLIDHNTLLNILNVEATL